MLSRVTSFRPMFIIAFTASLVVNRCHAIDVVTIVGAPGLDQYALDFSLWSSQWKSICERAGLEQRDVVAGGELTQREALQATLAELGGDESPRPLWLVFIGHGTWDGKTANFNLYGTDVSAQTLKEWIQPVSRPLVIAACFSSSGPFINRLSGKGRVIVTASKSGNEQNYARFGKYLVDALGVAGADLDHDDEISVREAFLKAVSDVEAFYRDEGRLASEHALLDDNGDRMGSSYEMVRGRAKAKGGEAIDGQEAGKISIPIAGNRVSLTDDQLRLREKLEAELELAQRQFGKEKIELRRRALPVLRQLAQLYANAESQIIGEVSDIENDGVSGVEDLGNKAQEDQE